MSRVAGRQTNPGAPALLALQDVDVSYGDVRALLGVCLEVRRGDRVGLLGASGSGKSTLLLALAGLVKPARGRVEGHRQSFPSLVFQFPERQLFAETVREDVAYGLAESGVARDTLAPRVRRALEEVGLPPDEFAERAPFHLSGGEMRRVALAGILAQERAVVLLDEPTLGLDAEGVARLRDILSRLHARGVAYWVASHDADFIDAVCDRAIVLADGAVSFDGAVRKLWETAARTESLGIALPATAVFAARLAAQGIAVPTAAPTEPDLTAALVSSGPPPHP